MNNQEFSASFDTLLNSYISKGSFGDTQPDIRLDEWEKSVFLTKFQEELVLSLYNGHNPYGASFESTEEMRRYLSPLVVEVGLNPESNTSGLVLGINSNSKFFTLPEDLWFITYEAVNVNYGAGRACGSNGNLEVVPVKQDEYHKVKNNPFRGANDRRALRLDLSDGVVEIVSKYPVSKYYVRYLKKVKPIVLVDLKDTELSVNGVNEESECELPEVLHRRILEGAVQMALRSKGIVAQSQ